MIEHIWRPETGITEIEGDWHALRASDVEGIRVVWGKQREQLKGTQQLAEFSERLNREWAIETGIIENLYDIDRGVTKTLIEHGFRAEFLSHGSTDKPRDYVVRLLRDQKDALEGVFDFVSQRRALSTSYIKELHAALLRSQTHTDGIDPSGRSIQVPLIRGDWKVQPNSPTRDGEIYAYCPPEQVASEMDCLVERHEAHIRDGVSAEVQAAWLHHRFTQIHPFQDGNGRVARALASLVLVQAGLFPLVVTRDDKGAYLDALETADGGDLKPLIGIIAKLQQRQFSKAIKISTAIITAGANVEQVLDDLDRAAVQLPEQRPLAILSVIKHAQAIIKDTETRLQGIKPSILMALRRTDGDAKVSITRSNPRTDQIYLSHATENTKNQLGRFPDPNNYHARVSLNMDWRRSARLVFSIRGVGRPFSGTLVCSPVLEMSDAAWKYRARSTSTQVADESFMFFHTETHQEVLARFQEWRERVLVTALRELTTNL